MKMRNQMNPINYSIIIPHYNIPVYLNRLLHTIPQRQDVQIIVVDDCSNQYIDILRTIKCRYPKVEWYSTGINGGAGKARNIGLEHAVGKYIIFADADDFFTVAFDDILEEYKDTCYDTIYFSACSLNVDTLENADRAEYFHRILGGYFKSKNIEDIRYAFVVPWSKIILREMIEKHNIRFATTNVSNDIMFSTLCDSHTNNITADARAIYCITTRENSLSKQFKPQDMLSRLKTEIWRFKFFQRLEVNRHPSERYFVWHIENIEATGDKNLLKEAENLLESNGISVKTVRKFVRKQKLRRIPHLILSALNLQRIKR